LKKIWKYGVLEDEKDKSNREFQYKIKYKVACKKGEEEEEDKWNEDKSTLEATTIDSLNWFKT